MQVTASCQPRSQNREPTQVFAPALAALLVLVDGPGRSRRCRSANGPAAGLALKRLKAQYSESASDLGLCAGADDGNRTRTVSLGS
jgi:hypothetical protein